MSDENQHAPGADDGKAPEVQSEHLNLKVKSQDGNEVYFKVRRKRRARGAQHNARRDRRLEGRIYLPRLGGNTTAAPRLFLTREHSALPSACGCSCCAGEEDDSVFQGDVGLLQEGATHARLLTSLTRRCASTPAASPEWVSALHIDLAAHLIAVTCDRDLSCLQVGADLESVRFLFDGQRLRPDQTPQDVS